MTGSSAAAPVVSKIPVAILVRGARVHNLQKVDVDIPLNKIVGIAGVSGSGKSSLALGVLYAEGSRRYLESLSTYTRRRMTQAARADVDDVRYIPAALALHQRPGVPGIRSTFGTMSELLNSLRLMFSRLASHRCPQGHYSPPSFAVATMGKITCPTCGEKFYGPDAEDLAFNSRGACPRCGGTGITRTVNEAALVPDENLTIDQGAVAVWGTLMWALMKDVCREMGVRTDVPFKDLTGEEKEIVYHGPAEKKHIIYVNPKTQQSAEMDFTYYSAVRTVENALAKVKDDKGMKRIERFLTEGVCPDCQGTRLSEAARAPRIGDVDLGQAAAMTLTQLVSWVSSVPDSLPQEMRPMGESICESFLDVSRRLLDLGLGYLSLDRAASTLSTGERQRVQLARAVRNRTTGVLYVLDEPSIGLHPYNLQGLTGVMDDLVADGNSVVLVDHDIQVLSHADWLIELGPGAGSDGGRVIGQGTVPQVAESSSSIIGPFLRKQLAGGDHLIGGQSSRLREWIADDHLFDLGTITLATDTIHTVRPLKVSIPQSRLTVVTGVSGSGKTTLILESLIPALMAKISKQKLPRHVVSLQAEGIRQVKLIDATPIGINVRSTVATYAGVHDELRKVYARTALAKQSGYKAGYFSYNTGDLRCPTCDGTGRISLDVQFLPDVDVTCPDCRGSRYSAKAHEVVKAMKDGKDYSLPDLMNMSVDQVLVACKGLSLLQRRVQVLHDLGLGYLTLGEDTPGLSGGEAQRLKLASEMGKGQTGSVFVFDEPTIGLHPKDVRTLLDVFETLIQQGATVIVIEHDLDLIRNADYIVDMGPGGGEEGGRVVAVGSPQEIRRSAESITGRYI